MSEAVSAYEEKPRDQWLFDYPAQVSLCGTQIWWTTEVNLAFERLEEVFDHKQTNNNSFIDPFRLEPALWPLPMDFYVYTLTNLIFDLVWLFLFHF